MKLTSVELHPANSSEVVALSFRDPRGLNPYVAKNITGLDADEIVPRAYGAPGFSGSFRMNNPSLLKRDVILQIGLNPNYTEHKSYSDLRDALYRMIASSRTGKIQLQFKDNIEAVAAISGFVSKFETSLFEKEQEVQLTITCDEPMLKAMEPVMLVDLDIPVFIIDDNQSTAPHGFSFVMNITGELPNIFIGDPRDGSWGFSIQPLFDAPLLADDVLYFSSEYNNKYLYIIRGEDTIHLGDAITPGSVWPIIFPGENVLTFLLATNKEWVNLSYYPTYWGV